MSVAKEFVAALPGQRYPYLVEDINYHVETDVLSEGDFEFGLDLLLLERLRQPAEPAGSAGAATDR